jgi:hypothetical protein
MRRSLLDPLVPKREYSRFSLMCPPRISTFDPGSSGFSRSVGNPRLLLTFAFQVLVPAARLEPALEGQ